MPQKLSKKFKLPEPVHKFVRQLSEQYSRLKLAGRVNVSVPARKIVLLPDAHFFCRAVPISETDKPAEVAAQIELALEAMSPFPPAQMYHGHFWKPGAKHACVFAAYRKRFTTEQVESWSDAEAVLPTFAAMLGAPAKQPMTLLLWSEKSLTAVNWSDMNNAPESIIARDLPTEPTDDSRAALRNAVLQESGFVPGVPVFSASGAAIPDAVFHQSGETRTIVEPATAPKFEEAVKGDEFTFRCASLSTAFTREELDVLDVRDKEELATRRRARARDLLLWRVLLGCFAAIALAAFLDIALIGGSIWQKARTTRVNLQEPYVAKIQTAKNLTLRIDERSSKRMRPFEMISMVAERKPNSVTFISASVTSPNLYTLDVTAQATTSSDINEFRSALTNMPWCESVELPAKDSRLVNGLTNFRVIVTFRPNAFKIGQQP